MVGSFSLLMFVPVLMNVALARELSANDVTQGDKGPGFFQQKSDNKPSFLNAAMDGLNPSMLQLATQTKVQQLQSRLAVVEELAEEIRSQLGDAEAAATEEMVNLVLQETKEKKSHVLGQQGDCAKPPCGPPTATCEELYQKVGKPAPPEAAGCCCKMR